MILAIDTATRSASLAVYDGAVVRAEYSWDTADHHTVELMPRIVDMLRQIDTADVRFELGSATSAGIVKPTEQEENEDLLMLIMPVRLS